MLLSHQPLLHPSVKFVGFHRCVLSNVVTFRVSHRSKLCVEPSMIVVCPFAVGLDCSVPFFDVDGRVP